MTTAENTVIRQKTEELCQAILDQAEFKVMRNRIEAFLANDDAKSQYQELSELSALLQEKRRAGNGAGAGEINQFEEKRQAFLSNPVAVGFLDAQESMNNVRESITKYVTRTFELGRVPEPADFESCGCDSGCGCH